MRHRKLRKLRQKSGIKNYSAYLFPLIMQNFFTIHLRHFKWNAIEEVLCYKIDLQ